MDPGQSGLTWCCGHRSGGGDPLQGISRRHARLEITADGRWLLEDHNSLAGTWISPASQEHATPVPPGVQGELFKGDIMSFGTPVGQPGGFKAELKGPTRERPDLPRRELKYMEKVVDGLRARYLAAAAAALQADFAAVHKEAGATVLGLKQAQKTWSAHQHNADQTSIRQKRRRAQAERHSQRRDKHHPEARGKRKRQRR